MVHHQRWEKQSKEYIEGFKCAVIEERETTEWFEIKTGVKQGCVMSGFLFLLVIDWVMKRATSEASRGIRWNFMTVLEDLDFADDIALLSSKIQDLKDKTEKVVEESERVGLKLNAKKCKTLRTKNTRNEDNIRIGNEEVEDVDQFVYFGAIIDKEGGGNKDIQHRLQKARGAFHRLQRIWCCRGIGRKTKLHLFKTLVRPVLFYGCETWKITKKDEH